MIPLFLLNKYNNWLNDLYVLFKSYVVQMTYIVYPFMIFLNDRKKNQPWGNSPQWDQERHEIFFQVLKTEKPGSCAFFVSYQCACNTAVKK